MASGFGVLDLSISGCLHHPLSNISCPLAGGYVKYTVVIYVVINGDFPVLSPTQSVFSFFLTIPSSDSNIDCKNSSLPYAYTFLAEPLSSDYYILNSIFSSIKSIIYVVK